MQEKYRGYHPRLPIVVAETLLASDPRIELPLWLVKMFKVSILQTFECFCCLFNSHHIEKVTYYPPFYYPFEQGVRQESSFGMSGSESNPASLLCLYVNYGRFVEATNLLLEYLESLASLVCFIILCYKFQNIQVGMKFLGVLAKLF